MTTIEKLKLTVDELNQIQGYERVKEKDALNVIENVFMMAILAFKAINNNQNLICYDKN